MFLWKIGLHIFITSLYAVSACFQYSDGNIGCLLYDTFIVLFSIYNGQTFFIESQNTLIMTWTNLQYIVYVLDCVICSLIQGRCDVWYSLLI